MKLRHVFSTPDLDCAKAAMDAARDAGVDDDDILLIARSDIELDSIPNERREADTDFMHGAVRGAGFGAAAGVVVALATMWLPSMQVDWPVALVIVVVTAAVGAFGSALMASSRPDPVRAQFDEQIKAGNILVIVDGSKELLTTVEPAIMRAGATPLPFEGSKAMS